MDINTLRGNFPILSRKFYGHDVIYLDNAATSQTPLSVISEINKGYTTYKANVHRGVSTISMEATERMETARRRIAKFIGAQSSDEIIFTRGTTEAINLIAQSYGSLLNDNDEVILTAMEHHANIVPWQLLQSRKKITIKVIPITPEGELDLVAFEELISPKTKIISVCHISNVLGTINPIAEIIAIAHRHGAIAVVDGAQAAPHISIDVTALDADFYTFSSHKMYGPTGVGVLYGKRELLEQMPPYQGGGEMIENVSFTGTTFAQLPFKFEAGTPDFIGISALDTTINFIEQIGYDNIQRHEQALLKYTQTRLIEEIPEIKIYGTSPRKDAIISFNLGDNYHYDVGMFLDRKGIVVRTGHHCAQPLMRALGVEGVVRASFAVYNTEEEAETFIEALKHIAEILR